VADPMSRFESLVDQQIRSAQERGEFDNLPGMGKPLPGWGSQDDEQWWLKNYLRREGLSTGALLPTSLRLAREIERLPEKVRDLPSEQAVREAVDELNREIADYLRAPSGPYAPVRPVDVDSVVERWRAHHRPGAAPADETAADLSRRGRWGRWFGRGRPRQGHKGP
jgi:hypothetical protein